MDRSDVHIQPESGNDYHVTSNPKTLTGSPASTPDAGTRRRPPYRMRLLCHTPHVLSLSMIRASVAKSEHLSQPPNPGRCHTAVASVAEFHDAAADWATELGPILSLQIQLEVTTKTKLESS